VRDLVGKLSDFALPVLRQNAPESFYSPSIIFFKIVGAFFQLDGNSQNFFSFQIRDLNEKIYPIFEFRSSVPGSCPKDSPGTTKRARRLSGNALISFL